MCFLSFAIDKARKKKYVAQMQLSENEKNDLLKAFPRGLIAIDLETTGLSPLRHMIVELAAIKVTPTEVTTYSSLIDPEIPIDPFVIAIHGITDEMVKGQPKTTEVIKKFFEFADGLPIIAHNAKFDLGFIVFHAFINKIAVTTQKIYCTITVARKCFPEFDGHKLKTLCERLNVKLENHHRALDDAYACLIVAARCIEKAIADGRNLEMLLQSSFQFTLDQFKENSFYQLPKHLREMEEYLGKNKSILIRYDGGTEKRDELRAIRPVAILPLPAGSILYALCEKDNHHKTFKIKKIKEWSLP